MAKRKVVKEESPQNFDLQHVTFDDFIKILKVVQNSEILNLKMDGEDVKIDLSKSDNKKIKVLNKRDNLIKTLSYKDDVIQIIGNRYDCFDITCEKKHYYLPITKSDGNIMILVGGKNS